MKLLSIFTLWCVFSVGIFLAFWPMDPCRSSPPVSGVVTMKGIPPFLGITQPDGVGDITFGTYAPEGQIPQFGRFTVEWTDDDPDSLPEIALYYSTVREGAGILIVSGLSQNSSEDSFDWTLMGVQPGSYFIRGVIWDNDNPPMESWSPGRLVVVDDPTKPFLSIDSPGVSAPPAGGTFKISWTSLDIDSEAGISIYYDSDPSGFDGTLIAGGLKDADGPGSLEWNIGALAPGNYWIYGIMDDGENETVRVYSSGPVPVNGAPFVNLTSPDGIGDRAFTNFEIAWIDGDPDNDAAISLYFDIDAAGLDGTLITGGIREDDETDKFIWDTTSVRSGRYWIYAVVSDGVNPQAYSYSPGPVLVERRGSIRAVRVSNISTGSAVISWIGDRYGTGTVDFGPAGVLSAAASGTTGTEHSLTLTGLSSDTPHSFKVSTAGTGFVEEADNGGNLYTFTTLTSQGTGNGPAIDGTLASSNGTPIAGGTVFLWAESGESHSMVTGLISVVTGGNGNFSIDSSRLTSLGASAYSLSAGDSMILEVRSPGWGRFHKRVAWDPASASITGVTLEYVGTEDSFVMPLVLKKGFNLISFPSPGIFSHTATSLLNIAKTITALYEFDASAQSYKACFKLDTGTYLGDFGLEPGKGYFAKTVSDAFVEIILAGSYPYPPGMTLRKGFNLVAIPYSEDPAIDFSTGQNTVSAISGSTEILGIYGWNAESSSYSVTINLGNSQVYGEAVPMTSDKGFFIKTAKDFSFLTARP